MNSSKQIWIKTSLFSVEPGEEIETNPGRFGKSLAKWLAEKFSEEKSFERTEVIGEDWGWCVMLQRKPFPLWVGCGNRLGSVDEWGAFVNADPGIFYRFRHSNDIRNDVSRIFNLLEGFLNAVPEKEKIWVED